MAEILALFKWFLFDVIKVPRKFFGIVIGTVLTTCVLFFFCSLVLGYLLLGTWFLGILGAVAVLLTLAYFSYPAVWWQIIKRFSAKIYYLETPHFAISTRPMSKAQFGVFFQACKAMCTETNNQITVKYLENWGKTEEEHKLSVFPTVTIRPDNLYEIAPADFALKINLFKSWKLHKKATHLTGQAEINEFVYLECCVDLLETINDIFDARGEVRVKYHSQHDVRALLLARYNELNDKMRGIVSSAQRTVKILNSSDADSPRMLQAATGAGIPGIIVGNELEEIEESDGSPANVRDSDAIAAIKELTAVMKEPKPVYQVPKPKKTPESAEDTDKKTRAPRTTDKQIYKAIRLVLEENMTKTAAEKKCGLPVGALSKGRGKELLDAAIAAIADIERRKVSDDVGDDFRYGKSR